MELSKDSYLVRWTYLLGDTPYQTSLCAFFWRCFVWMPLFGLVILTFVGSVFFLVGDAAYHHPFKALAITIGATILITLLRCRIDRAATAVGKRIEETVAWQGIKAIKNKVCPILVITE